MCCLQRSHRKICHTYHSLHRRRQSPQTESRSSGLLPSRVYFDRLALRANTSSSELAVYFWRMARGLTKLRNSTPRSTYYLLRTSDAFSAGVEGLIIILIITTLSTQRSLVLQTRVHTELTVPSTTTSGLRRSNWCENKSSMTFWQTPNTRTNLRLIEPADHQKNAFRLIQHTRSADLDPRPQLAEEAHPTRSSPLHDT